MSSVVEAASPEETAPAVIDLEALLAPIPGDNPSGEELRYSGIYDEIREARRAEDSLEQGDWKRDPKMSEWDEVERLGLDALTTRSKDLQIGAWLAEAIVRRHGFAALRDCLKLMRGLHEQFWETLYPEVEDDDLEGRANTLSFLDRQLADALRQVAITNASGGLINCSFLQSEDSKQFEVPENYESLDSDTIERVNELKARAHKENRVTSEDWRKAKAATRRAFYEETFALLGECWAEFQALDRVVDEKFGRQTPGLGELKKSLDTVRSFVEKIVKEKRILEPDPAGEAEATAADATGEQGGGGDSVGGGSRATSGPVRSRQEALRRLREVADFFRQTEPHSPVSYLVQRAAKWGDMPLEMWLTEVIKDNNVLSNLRETLGIEDSNNGGGGYSE